MALQVRSVHLATLAGYVAASSFLGLAILSGLSGPGPFAVVARIWGASLFADLLFVVGTCATGYAAYKAAARKAWATSLAWGWGGTWLTYMVSFLALVTGDPSNTASIDLAGLPVAIVQFGWPGIAVAGTLPLVAAHSLTKPQPAVERSVVLAEVPRGRELP